MKLRVYKYPIPIQGDRFLLHLPEGSKFLRVSWQKNDLFVWFLVPIEAKLEWRNFIMYGTGHDILPNCNYLTTYDNGPFVFHLFEVLNG